MNFTFMKKYKFELSIAGVVLAVVSAFFPYALIFYLILGMGLVLLERKERKEFEEERERTESELEELRTRFSPEALEILKEWAANEGFSIRYIDGVPQGDWDVPKDMSIENTDKFFSLGHPELKTYLIQKLLGIDFILLSGISDNGTNDYGLTYSFTEKGLEYVKKI